MAYLLGVTNGRKASEVTSLVSQNLRGELTIPAANKIFEHKDSPSSIRHRLSDLLWAVQRKDVNAVRNAIDDDTISAYSPEGSTALHLACQLGYAEIVAILLENGAFVFAKSKPAGHTALYLAQAHGQQDIVTMLEACGAHLGSGESFDGGDS